MDLSRELTRGGVRGGREQFKWDSLKSMSTKEREHYLGSIVHVGVPGKFGQSNTHDWWKGATKSSESSKSVSEEKSRVKDMETELMQEALGLKPKRLMLSKNKLSSDQVDDILKKEDHADGKTEEPSTKRMIPRESEAVDDDTDRGSARGLGFRKYLKDNEWNKEPEVEDLEAPGEVIRIKREEYRPIKEEQTDSARANISRSIKVEAVSPPRRERRRSRSPRAYSSRRY